MMHSSHHLLKIDNPSIYQICHLFHFGPSLPSKMWNHNNIAPRDTGVVLTSDEKSHLCLCQLSSDAGFCTHLDLEATTF